MVWQALFELGGELLGDALSAKRQNSAMEAQVDRQLAAQREMAQSGVQWRVQDAQKAGVHPLFALGAQLPSFSPVSVFSPAVPDYGAAGRGVARAFRADEGGSPRISGGEYTVVREAYDDDGEPIMVADQMSYPEARQYYDIELVRSQIEASNQAILESRARANNERFVGQGVGAGASEYRPDQVVSPSASAGYLTAGVHPGWSRFVLDDNFVAILPSASSMSEAIEAISESKLVMGAVLARNIAEFGPNWIKRARSYFPEWFR